MALMKTQLTELAKQRDRLFKEVEKLVLKQRSLPSDDFDAYDILQQRIDELKWITNMIIGRQTELATKNK